MGEESTFQMTNVQGLVISIFIMPAVFSEKHRRKMACKVEVLSAISSVGTLGPPAHHILIRHIYVHFLTSWDIGTEILKTTIEVEIVSMNILINVLQGIEMRSRMTAIIPQQTFV